MGGETGAKRKVYTFAEQDYRFGVGPLRLVIVRIDWSAPIRYEGEDWYEVAGMEVASDGRDMGRRSAQVRGSRLTHHRSP